MNSITPSRNCTIQKGEHVQVMNLEEVGQGTTHHLDVGEGSKRRSKPRVDDELVEELEEAHDGDEGREV
jgi:hypothetical protein